MTITAGREVEFENRQRWAGKHCETTALKRVLDNEGHHYSEEMLLGLGGGLGFILP